MLPPTGTQAQQEVTTGSGTVKEEEQHHLEGEGRIQGAFGVWCRLASPGTAALYSAG